MCFVKNMTSNLQTLRRKIDKMENSRDFQRKLYLESRKRLKEIKKTDLDLAQALHIVQETAKGTQQLFGKELSSLVTKAIAAIFSKDYRFVAEFVSKRGKTEVELYLVDENGHHFRPMDDNGGGVVDVISFALRLACWKLQNPKTDSVMIYDEPLKYVSRQYKSSVCTFLKSVCRALDMQIIMITHEEEYIGEADNIIEIR